MLTDLINKFKHANGRSDFVIVVVCDIRGFSSFSKNHEAPDIAMFSKRFFVRLLEEYFNDADFAKSTGDGLLLLFRYSEINLHEVAASVIRNCLKVVRDFPMMMANDPMINYKVPDAVGFGIARGTAFCLHADNELVDYSGQTLNLASRLNEFARPHGLVIDGNFMMSVIPDDVREDFFMDMVFVPGIAEDHPREVFCSKDVVLPHEARVPSRKSALKSVDYNVAVGLVKRMPENITIRIPEPPIPSSPCIAKVEWMHSTATLFNRNAPEYTVSRQLPSTKVEQTVEGYFVHLRTNEVVDAIADKGLSSKANLTIKVQYVAAA